MFKGIVLVGITLGGAAIASAQTAHDAHAGSAPTTASAKAMLKDAKGQPVGEVTLRQTKEGLLLKADLRNLPPGPRAFHIHEAGTCTAPKFDSAGPHFAPSKAAHGLLNPSGPHEGDMPNVHIPQGGSLSVELVVPNVTLEESGGASLFDANGSALVLHAKADDYATDPSGNAGDRIACGVITR